MQPFPAEPDETTNILTDPTLNIYGRRLATPGARASAERHGLRMRRAA